MRSARARERTGVRVHELESARVGGAPALDRLVHGAGEEEFGPVRGGRPGDAPRAVLVRVRLVGEGGELHRRDPEPGETRAIGRAARSEETASGGRDARAKHARPGEG